MKPHFDSLLAGVGYWLLYVVIVTAIVAIPLNLLIEWLLSP